VAHVCNTSTWKAEAVGSWVSVKAGLPRETSHLKEKQYPKSNQTKSSQRKYRTFLQF
jgi:hypothetical protein